jgi:hypothetical protein
MRIEADTLVELVAAIRAADERHWRDGGRYLQDCLLPEFDTRGITLVLPLDGTDTVALLP